MPVIGAVLHLERATGGLLADLRRDSRIALGDLVGARLPIATSTTSRREDKDLWRHIERLPGVMHVELVFADFSDLTDPVGCEVTP